MLIILPGLIEKTHVDEAIDLKFDAIAGLGLEPEPAVLILVKLQRFNLAVAKFGGGKQLGGIQRDVAHCTEREKNGRSL